MKTIRKLIFSHRFRTWFGISGGLFSRRHRFVRPRKDLQEALARQVLKNESHHERMEADEVKTGPSTGTYVEQNIALKQNYILQNAAACGISRTDLDRMSRGK